MTCKTWTAMTVLFLLLPVTISAQKTYKHASEYQMGMLDEQLRVYTGNDATLARTQTDAKMGTAGTQGIHLLHTDRGNFRVEAPVNTGMSILAAMAAGNSYRPAPTVHNKWFLDSVHPGTQVLFAARCGSPGKKHPYETVRCEFWFPDPDSADHEYRTLGDFTPYAAGDGSNTQKTANVLCGTGKLKPEVEAQICHTTGAQPAPAPPGATLDHLPSTDPQK